MAGELETLPGQSLFVPGGGCVALAGRLPSPGVGQGAGTHAPVCAWVQAQDRQAFGRGAYGVDVGPA